MEKETKPLVFAHLLFPPYTQSAHLEILGQAYQSSKIIFACVFFTLFSPRNYKLAKINSQKDNINIKVFIPCHNPQEGWWVEMEADKDFIFVTLQLLLTLKLFFWTWRLVFFSVFLRDSWNIVDSLSGNNFTDNFARLSLILKAATKGGKHPVRNIWLHLFRVVATSHRPSF